MIMQSKSVEFLVVGSVAFGHADLVIVKEAKVAFGLKELKKVHKALCSKGYDTKFFQWRNGRTYPVTNAQSKEIGAMGIAEDLLI